MKIYLIIWDNGQEYDHDYNVIAAFSDDAKAQSYRNKWNSDYEKETEDEGEDEFYRREYVYIQETNLIS